MTLKNKIIIIAGPTAVGKSDLGVEIAKRLNGEVISADSMQIYQHMDIGSAKPTIQEMQGIPHHLIDFISPLDDYSVADYQSHAKACIKDIISRGKVPVVVGGTGLYINALLYDMDFGGGGGDEAFRAEMEQFAEEKGAEAIYELLKERDPASANRIHPNNVKRVIRALEVAHVSDGEMKDFSTDLKPTSDYEVLFVGLDMLRMKLYARINKRVEIMMDKGLVDEVKKLKELGLCDRNRSMQGIGYKEVLYFLEDRFDLEQMVSLIKQNSRRYAKRQLTWFRRYDFIKWFNVETYQNGEALAETVERYIRENY